ncbi:CBS domain-containing protein [Streptomyces sp. NPDC093093]|uniref:CBS domain-containing protein n=1 Tax=Streptomyces sp. NPDC093093 TaxID=3366025 RepID=UPI0038131421
MNVSDQTSAPAVTIPPRTPVGEVARQMGEYGIGSVVVTEGRTGVRRLPVLDGNQVVGMLTVDDLLMDVFQRLADLLGVHRGAERAYRSRHLAPPWSPRLR